MKKEIALTIKPTLLCNMKCKHCFNGIIEKNTVLPVEQAVKFIEIASRSYDIIKVTFHGGEPTLAGKDYYKTIFEYQKSLIKEKGMKFHNNFTTNGLILDEEFLQILIDNDALINISYDGLYNDVLRTNGDKVYENIKLAQKMGARLRVFCTISSESSKNLIKNYNWFNAEGLDFKILPIEPRGFAKNNKELLLEPNEFAEKLADLYKIWVKDTESKIRFYTFEEFAQLRRTIQFKPYWFNREIALNPDGKIYPFGRPNDIKFCLGHVLEVQTLEECFLENKYKIMKEELDKLQDKYCNQCNCRGVCNGVVICMSYMYVSETKLLEFSCNQSKKIFESILNVNDEIIEDFENGNGSVYHPYIVEQFSNIEKK